MFKMIEAQHRTELRSQHEQHERLLQEMQHNMARELSKQQDTLKHSLTAHREVGEGISNDICYRGKDYWQIWGEKYDL